MSMQMLSAAARGEEAEAAGGFPDGAPWPGGHTEGLPRSPCQPQTGTRWLSPGLYTDLWQPHKVDTIITILFSKEIIEKLRN